MRNDPTYLPGSADNAHVYGREYVFADEDSCVSSKHGLLVSAPGGESYSCILLAGGGASGVHEHSALVHGDRCVVAVGRDVCCLRLPGLELEWRTRADWATCFGVYHSPRHGAYLSHGELEIARLSYSGEVEWSAGGRDIFTNGFTLHEDHVEAVDFNGESYRFDIATGLCRTSGA